jgi:CheY-like chemotaxis protein
LSLMLKRGIEVLVGAALVVAILAVLPAVAEAQGMATPQDERGANHGVEVARVVVRPGDSLWSISEEHLGPNTTPRQIANTVERIYALNRVQIGADPDLILQGQNLLLPPIVRATPARNAAEPAESSPTGRGVKGGRERASRTTVGEAGSKVGRTSDPVAEPVALPDMPTRQVTPKVVLLSVTDAPSPVESFGRTARALLLSVTSAIVGLLPQDPLLRRKLFGWGIMALTVLVTGLLAWKLPLERNVGGYGVWGIPRGYVGGYAPRTKGTDRYGGTPDLAPAPPIAEPEWGRFESEALAVENDASSAGIIVATRRRRVRIIRQQARGSRRSPHWVLATGVHQRQVMRLLCQAQTAPRRTFARSLRLHRGTSPRNEGDYEESGKAFAETQEPTSQPESLMGRKWEAVDPEMKRALMVAKHALFREGLATVLEWREGFKVAQAESLAGVLRILRTLDSEPEIAVVDLELPSGDGVELIREIHETWRRVPILALTTSRDPERATRAKEAGAGEVVSTAASSEELFEEVRRLKNG